MAFKHDPENPHSISNNVVLAISEDDFGNFWLGTWHGLSFLHRKYIENPDPRTAQSVHYNHDSNNPNSLSDDRIWTIYIDREGIIWIGTDTGGFNRFDPTTEIFKHYRHDPSDPESLLRNNVRCIYEYPVLKRRTFWIGTHGGGLHKFDVMDEVFERENLVPQKPPGWGPLMVLSVRRDKNKRLWAGNWSGLKKYLFKNNETFPSKHIWYTKEFPGFSGNSVKTIYEDRTGILRLHGQWYQVRRPANA